MSAAIDDRGTNHVSAVCDGGIHYSVREAEGSWSRTEFAPAANREDQSTQLAFEDDTLYLAYSRVAIEGGGCGDDDRDDIGVLYRSRTLPTGEWSDAARIGVQDDLLQSFRVANGTIHASVRNAIDSRVYYESFDGGEYVRVLLPDAVGGTSLRIGNDGRARIAYEAQQGLRYSRFTGSGLDTTDIPGSPNSWKAQLILGPADDPHLVWTRTNHAPGCADGAPADPGEGIYYGTQVNGTWQIERLTTDVGTASLTLDVETGRIHVVVAASGDQHGTLTYYTKSAGGRWTSVPLAAPTAVPLLDIAPVIRLDSLTGKLLVVFVGQLSPGGDGETIALTTR